MGWFANLCRTHLFVEEQVSIGHHIRDCGEDSGDQPRNHQARQVLRENGLGFREGIGGSESIEWLIEDQAFSRSYNSAPSPIPSPPLTMRKRQVAAGRVGGRGWARSQIIRPQESLVLYEQSILSVAGPQEGTKIGGFRNWVLPTAQCPSIRISVSKFESPICVHDLRTIDKTIDFLLCLFFLFVVL